MNKFKVVCASQQGRSLGMQLWGVLEDGRLFSTFQKGPNAPWEKWSEWPGAPQQIIALTAAPTRKGALALWALTADHVLHCKSQTSAQGDWSPWSDPSTGWWKAPKLIGICASMQGGPYGRAIWGIGEDRQLYWTYEQAAQGGEWVDRWPRLGVAGEPQNISSLCAARQNDGCVALWALSQDNSLHNITQTTPGGGWTEWDIAGTRWQNLQIIDEIVRTLLRKPGNEGVTYLRSSGNKFTLLDTPRLWGRDPTTTGQQSEACRTFLNAITDVIGNAERTVDITLLWNVGSASGMPDGDFQLAISKGFKALSDKGKKPVIRILVGAPIDPSLFKKVSYPMPPLPHYTLGTAALQALLGTYYAKMKTWLQDTITRCQPIAAMKCPVQIGLNHPNTWNHAKIIAVDDTRVITGGHNFWAGDYLGAAPVHDVSGLFEGPAARAARQFCEKVWHLTTQTISLIDGKFTSVSPIRVIDEDPIPPAGNVEMLSLGRLGRGLAPNFSISTNASVTARIVALCKAKNLIRISQQSLLGFGLNPYEFYTCLAIVRAVRAGVNVQIVLSNELPNYGGSAPAVLRQLQWMYLADIGQTDNRCKNAPPRDKIDAWADLAASPQSLGQQSQLDPAKKALLGEFNNKLKLATLYYSDNAKQWKVGSTWKNAGNHSKIYIIDEDCFYVGSDNFYASMHKEGLQEFGYLVEDKNETRKFIAAYWDNLWKYSGKMALS